MNALHEQFYSQTWKKISALKHYSAWNLQLNKQMVRLINKKSKINKQSRLVDAHAHTITAHMYSVRVTVWHTYYKESKRT